MGIRTLPVMTGLHRLAEKVDTWQLGDCSSCSLEIMDSGQISLRGQPPQLGDLRVHTVAPVA